MLIGELWRRWQVMARRRQFDADLDEEIQLHLDLRAEQTSKDGARRRFGNRTRVKETSREMWIIGPWAVALAQDTRFAIRSFAKTRGFTALAVLTLALGIGASTAVFTLLETILLKPLPYPEAEKIVLPWRISPRGIHLSSPDFPWDRASFNEFARISKTFQHAGAFVAQSYNLTGVGSPVKLDGMRVSAAFFASLGIPPLLGRFITEGEDRPGQGRVVVLGHAVWMQRFGGNPEIVGRTLDLNGVAHTVVGVMPPGFTFPRASQMPSSFTFPRETEIWVPIALEPGPLARGEPSELAVIGRLRPEVTIEQAQAELDQFARHLAEVRPAAKEWVNARIRTLARQISGDTRRPLMLIFGAVNVVLLIACCNVANLLLARSLKRKREFMLRAALGAGSGRLVRQLLAESVVLALAGGAAGLIVAQAAMDFVKAFAPSSIPRLAEARIDPPVFVFALALTLITGIAFGLAPAIASRRVDLADSLKDGSRSTPRGFLRDAILIAEVALALVLVVAAGLLVRSFLHMLAADAGFSPAHVLTFELTLPEQKYARTEQIVDLYRAVLDRLKASPGVQSAGITAILPVGGAGESTAVRIPDHPVTNPQERPLVNYTMISPGYFSAVGTPVLRGRDFLESDQADSQPVTIINQAMARKLWPDQNPVGKAVGLPIKTFDMTIVGVVSDVKHVSVREETGPEIYVPYTQKPWPSLLSMQVALRTTSDLAVSTGFARDAVRSVDPDLPLANVRMLEEIVSESMTQPRFSMLLVTIFGALAVALAAVGMYGVIAYSVTQRTQEIGIRMALGASRSDILKMIIGQSARFAAAGVLIGIAAALAVTPMIRSFLFGVPPSDPLTFAGVSLLLIGVALLASYIPARRAMRLNPTIALKYD